MAKAILMRHDGSGLVKKGYYGYSWTYLFFGWFVPLFRGELGVAALHFFFSFITVGIWQLIFSFLYNKQYMTRMLTAGWKLAGTAEENHRAAIKLGMDPRAAELAS